MSVLLETSLGDIVIDLLVDECPKACLNFLKLCKIKYYNYTLFHNIQKDFIVQTGDPTGTGRGGTSIYGILEGPKKRLFKDEIHPHIKHTTKGVVGMAGAGKDANGSQFYITCGDNLESLDNKHTIFGHVVEDGSFETLAKINDSFCDESGVPYRDIRIKHTIILDDPFDDLPGLVVPDESPLPSKEQLETGRLAEDEEINQWAGKTDEEIQEAIKDREAYAQAQILEMVGDLPDANIKPPENVLFVCKLNKITQEDDLQLIFGRFGEIVSCNIVKDPVTKESLCYAFIEFETQEACEEAYFKMDNTLIDDHRIKVDFSQSVSRAGFPKDFSKQPRFDSRDASMPSGIRIKNAHRASSTSGMVFEHDEIDSREKHHKPSSSSSSSPSSSRSTERHSNHSNSGHSSDSRHHNSRVGSRDSRDHRDSRDRNSRDSNRDHHHRHRSRSRSKSRSRSRSRSRSPPRHKSHRDRSRSRSPERRKSSHHYKERSSRER